MRCRERGIYRLIQKRSHIGWVYLVALMCLFLVTFWGTVVTERNSAKQKQQRAANTEKFPSAPSQPDSLSGIVASSRRLYPYSVIPGGVESAQELRNALAHDPIAAAHYAGFDLSQTHVVRLAQDEEMYVSYRLNNRIYWTHKRLRLLKGEALITDGKNTARTRCGNRLSSTAEAPTAAKQPFDMTLDPSPLPDMASARPIILPMALPFPASSSLMATGSGSEGGTFAPPSFPIVGGGVPSSGGTLIPPTTPTTPAVATPEPDTLAMTAAGITLFLGSGWFGFFRRRTRT